MVSIHCWDEGSLSGFSGFSPLCKNMLRSVGVARLFNGVDEWGM